MPLFGIIWVLHDYTDLDVTIARNSVGEVGIKYICFGREVCPTTGRRHLQGYLQANHDKYDRFKRRLGNSVHLEKMRGDSREAKVYCEKDGDFEEYGAYEFIDAPKKRQGERKDLDSVKDAIAKGAKYDEIVDAHFACAAKYGRFIKEQIQARDNGALVKSLKESFAGAVLRPWQTGLLGVLRDVVCPRKIHWMWESSGNVGKSWMTRYLLAMEDCTVLTEGKKTDMAYIFAKKPTKIVVIDLCRTNTEFLNGIYSLAENLKNGYIVSSKYDSTGVVFEIPHVVIFANFEPDYTKWSADRYNVVEIH